MINLILGTMRSGKSTSLINEYIKLQSANKKAIIIKHNIDNRKYFARNIGLNIEYKTQEFLFDNSIYEYEYILIDETQFFTDKEIDKIIELSVTKNIFCYGLNSKAIDKNGKILMWNSIVKLMPYAEKIEKLNAYCEHCKKTAIIQIRNSAEQIGDNYTLLCLECYNKKNNKGEKLQ